MKLSYSLIFFSIIGIACVPRTNKKIVNNNPNKPIEASVEVAPSSFAEEMLVEVNKYRSTGCKCGRKRMSAVSPLTWNNLLTNAASAHARDMQKNDFFDHKGSDGSNMAERASSAGYRWMFIGENIALGPPDIKTVVAGWIQSPGHCKNIMSSDYTEIGAARAGDYWVQVFGAR